MISLSLIAAILLASIASARRSKTHSIHQKTRHIRPNSGNYAFDYGKSMTVFTSFFYFSKIPTALTLFDCYCSGDQFEIFDNGILLGATNVLPDTGSTACLYYSDDPQICWSSPGACNQWSFLKYPLPPGNHNLTISVIANPYGKGTGYLRIDDWCSSDLCCKIYFNQCPNGLH